MNYEIIQKNYARGLWSRAQVEVAVRKGVITRAQADAIYEGVEAPSEDITPDEILNILNGEAE